MNIKAQVHVKNTRNSGRESPFPQSLISYFPCSSFPYSVAFLPVIFSCLPSVRTAQLSYNVASWYVQ